MRLIYDDDAIYELKRAFPADDFGKIIRCISRTPTADLPERNVENLIDIEQRIFLAAMSREENVCKEMQKEMPATKGLIDLVRVCREIKRKVKKALWT